MNSLYCPVCGEPAHTSEQEPMLPHLSPQTLVDCRQQNCPFRYFTLEESEWLALTPEQIAAALAMNKAQS